MIKRTKEITKEILERKDKRKPPTRSYSSSAEVMKEAWEEERPLLLVTPPQNLLLGLPVGAVLENMLLRLRPVRTPPALGSRLVPRPLQVLAREAVGDPGYDYLACHRAIKPKRWLEQRPELEEGSKMLWRSEAEQRQQSYSRNQKR